MFVEHLLPRRELRTKRFFFSTDRVRFHQQSRSSRSPIDEFLLYFVIGHDESRTVNLDVTHSEKALEDGVLSRKRDDGAPHRRSEPTCGSGHRGLCLYRNRRAIMFTISLAKSAGLAGSLNLRTGSKGRSTARPTTFSRGQRIVLRSGDEEVSKNHARML
jgi:hypothetical protein